MTNVITPEAPVASPVTVNPPAEKPELQFEIREIHTKDGQKYSYKFLVIDSPDKWLPASSYSCDYIMQSPGSSDGLRFKFQGVSFQQLEDIEWVHEEPDLPPASDRSQEQEQQYRVWLMTKRANLFEVSSGKKIPGEDYYAKARFLLSKFNDADVEAMHKFIQSSAAALGDGILMQRYYDLALERSNQGQNKVVEFKDMGDWEEFCKASYSFLMQRPADDYIIEFPLKNLTAEQKISIEFETKEPPAPQMPSRDPATRKFIPGKMEPDFKNPGWRAKCREIAHKRTAILIESCLMFEIPGTNISEKYNWISQRTCGDVYRLKTFIEDEVCNYHSRLKSFYNT